MKAIVAEKPGAPKVLTLQDVPKPTAKSGWVVIRVKAFGLNRSELFTRQGESPGVEFPRVLGIECVGIVESAPQTAFSPGQTVAAIMGGMGRIFDGSYAEYTLVPASSVFPLKRIWIGEHSVRFLKCFRPCSGLLRLGWRSIVDKHC